MIIREGTIKTNFKSAPKTKRPPPPNSQATRKYRTYTVHDIPRIDDKDGLYTLSLTLSTTVCSLSASRGGILFNRAQAQELIDVLRDWIENPQKF